MQQADFLVEIHTEELPPKSLRSLAENFYHGIITRLQKAGLEFTHATYFATPRRLAVLVYALSAQQPNKMVERKGPALDKAYDADGKPTPALLGFARSCHCEITALITLPNGFVGVNQEVKGKTSEELLPQIVEETITNLPIPKPMRWGNHTQKFIRPVHSVILLYGKNPIHSKILGCTAGNKTYGHRFLHPHSIEILEPQQYETLLEKAYVIADFDKRKKNIFKQLTELSTKLNATFVENESLLDEVTSLVEWPNAICGHFDNTFLEVPAEALIAAMQDHQRYFPVWDKSGQLLPHFITISNIECKDPQRIITGNERVLRARLSDAAFFYHTDKKTSLESRVEQLKKIVFQNKLGTLFDKTERIIKLADFIANKLSIDTQSVARAALLCKTDLTTNLVSEFPELQGIAGYYYALNDHESPEVANALNQQYKPRFSGDDLPNSGLACVLAIADRLDTLVGVFGINQPPTGDKDPFGLRRAALGILRILIEKQYNLDLHELIHVAAKNFIDLENKKVAEDTLQFILERLKPWYMEQNISANVIASVMALNLSQPYDIHCRIQAVMVFKNLPEAESLSSANKRVSNILTKSNHEITATEIKNTLFENEAEKILSESVEAQTKNIENTVKITMPPSEQYTKMLSELAKLRVPVDNFFDNVMVMTEDKEKRENRLLILKKLRELFLHVADIALLQ